MSRERNTQAQRTRPLTARSVLLSVLLGSTPPRLPVGVLVRTAELFGIAEGATRTALSRMATAGEITVDGGAYAITGSRLLERQARQAESRAAPRGSWRGERWLSGVVVAERRRATARAELRAAMVAARLAELREGVWLRPDNLADRPALDHVNWFSAVPDDDPVALAARLWDLQAWAADANALRERMGRLLGGLRAGDHAALAPGFVLSAEVLRHFQADPLLPDALLPSGWPGGELRAEYDRYDAAYRNAYRSAVT